MTELEIYEEYYRKIKTIAAGQGLNLADIGFKYNEARIARGLPVANTNSLRRSLINGAFKYSNFMILLDAINCDIINGEFVPRKKAKK